jgi:hypothetical protein
MRPLDRTLALLDPLLAGAALLVEGDDIFIPGPQNLARDPGMGRLADGEDAGRLASKGERRRFATRKPQVL